MREKNPLGWLQRLKDESWEAELLISAVFIFAILNAFTPLNWLVNFFINNLPPNQYFYGFMISFTGFLALGILGAFFIIHLGLRAYWIGLVGLNSVFPDYSLKDSAYSEIYTKKMSEKLPKLPDTIKALDEICSVIFSAAFAFLLLYVNASIISGLLLWIYNLADDYGFSSTIYYLFIVLLSLIGVLYMLAIVANIKKYKNDVRVQSWYYHVAIISSKAMFGPFYLYILQVSMIFGSNFKKKKSIIIAIFIMMAFGIGFAVFQVLQSNTAYLSRTDSFYDQNRLYPHHYKTNNSQKRFLFAPEIQSEVISSHVIKIFVPLLTHEVDQMEKACEKNNPKQKNPDSKSRQEEWQWNLNCYANKVTLFINNDKVELAFAKTEHPVTEQLGLFAFINLSNLEYGQHQLSVVKDVLGDEEKVSNISFYFSDE